MCDAVENSLGYGAFAELLDKLFGTRIGDAFRASSGFLEVPSAPKSPTKLASQTRVDQHNGKVRFKSIAALVSAMSVPASGRCGSWMTSSDDFSGKAEAALQPFVMADGSVEFNMPALIVTAQKYEAEPTKLKAAWPGHRSETALCSFHAMEGEAQHVDFDLSGD